MPLTSYDLLFVPPALPAAPQSLTYGGCNPGIWHFRVMAADRAGAIRALHQQWKDPSLIIISIDPTPGDLL